MKDSKNWIWFGVLIVLQGILLYLSQNHFLFWDTIQFAGKHTSYFFEIGLSNGFLVPDSMDSGHPPTFAFYLVFFWKLFGKSLMVSHWAMFPFLIVIIYQSFKLGEFCLSRIPWLFPVMLMACPFYLGHSILVSPDLIVLFGFLMSLRGILSSKGSLIILGTVLLSLTSLRGMALMLSLYIFSLYIDRNFTFKKLLSLGIKKLQPFLPALLLALGFLIFHFSQKGWISHHEDSPWNLSFAKVGFKGLMKNVLFMGHKMLDFGMIVVYLLLAWKFRFLALLKGRLIWLWIFCLIIIAFLVLPYQGLLNHRYFLPLQVIALLMAAQILVALRKRILTGGILIFLFLGNFWIYPDKISQGWDSTLAHMPYYDLVEDFRMYIAEENIAPNEICTAFPLKGELRFKTLDNQNDNFSDYHTESCSYVLYSNIMNDFTDEELDHLQTKEVIYQSRKRGIKIILYQE